MGFYVCQLTDSTPFLHQSDALRANLERDSYLFFRGLINEDHIKGLRAEILHVLASLGWLATGVDPLEAKPGPVLHYSRGRRDDKVAIDEGWYEGYVAIQRLEAFHKLAHDMLLLDLMQCLLDDDVIVHPRKIARVSFPGSEYPTPPHQDVLFNEGTPDVLTAWIPLGDIPQLLGGLHVLRGSAAMGVLKVQPANGVGGEEIALDLSSGEWMTADYQLGDVVVFHGFSVHMAPANRGDRIRISVDYRYQSARDPIKPSALQPHAYGTGRVPSWGKLSGDWSSLAWIDVPHPIRIVHSRHSETPTSRLIRTR